MALPILSASNSAPGRAIDEIRKNLTGKPAANDPEISREPPTPPAAEKTSKSKVVNIQQARQRKGQPKIERVPSSSAENSRRAANDINEKAIERSQSQTNPLIPLLSSMNGTLSSMNGTLKSILGVLKTQTELLSKILSKVDIGDSNDDIGGGGRRPREKTRRERARDRLRERQQRQRDRARPPGRARRAARAGLRAGKKGLLGLASIFGLSQLLPEPVQDAIDVADTGADISEVARGGRGAAGAGAQAGRFSKILGTGGKVLSRLAAPLAIGMSLYENSDELLKTGKVDPLKQAEKMGGGLMDIINPQNTEGDVGGMHIMKRIGGVGDVISGATGAVLGAGTQVGSVIKDMIPTDFSDSIVDGIVGLLGGETNADREKKAKEVQAKLEKELEEKKKIRLEAEKKAVEEKAKKEAEDKAKQEAEKKATSPTAPGVPPVVVDTSGKPVPAIAPGQTKESAEEIKRAATEEALKPNMPTSVSILQPDGKPIPVMLTDEKGKPLITSLDQAAANTPGFKAPAAPAGASGAPETTPPQTTPAAQAPASGIPAGATPVAQAAQSPAPQQAQPAEVSQQVAENRKKVSEMLGIPAEVLPAAGAGMTWALNQQNAVPEKYRNNPPPKTGARTTGPAAPRRQNPAENSGAQAQAQNEAIAQDRAIPPAPAPQNTTTQPPATGVGQAPGVVVPGAPGQRTVAGSYTPTPEDSKYFKGDLSKLEGMDPVFVDKLKAASAEAGVALPLTSGFRSQEKQDQLRAEAVKKYGSEEAASKWVAKTSIHTTGNAADFSMGGDAKKFWESNPKLVAAMEKQGLHRPLAHEAWHWESDVTKGQDRKGLASKLIAQRDASLAAGTQPQTTQTPAAPAPTLAQTAQGAAMGVSGMLATQGVPGAAAVTGAIAAAPKVGQKLTKITEGMSLGDMLSVHESKGNYNIFNQGKAHNYKQGEKDFSKMTVNEVMAQQNLAKSDPNKLFAVGKYQIIPDTMKAAAEAMGLKGDEKFTPELQDRIFNDYLVQKKQSSIGSYIKTGEGLDKAARASGAEWASVGVEEKGGRSLYGGVNKAFVSPEQMKKTLVETRQKYLQAKASGMSEQDAMRAATTGASGGSEANPAAPALAAAGAAPPSPAQITPVPASATATENRKKVSEMLGLPAEALPMAGEGMAWLLNQQNAIPEKYRNNPRQTPGERQRTTGPAAARRQNSSSQEDLRGLYAKETFTGSVPPPAEIPSTMPMPPELSTAPARAQQNYQLLGHPNVQATIDTLQAGGADVVSNLGSTAARLGVGALPSPISSGISAVDQLRTNGAFGPMMSGDLPGVLSRVAPSLTSFPGLQSVFNQSAAGGGGFARQFNSATGDALKGTVPKALGAALGGVAGGALSALGGAASNMLGGLLSPQSQETSGPLESAGFADKQNERNAAAPPQQPAASSASGASRVSPERGSSLMRGDQAPLEVRNSESSIRRLTDMLIAFSFG